MVTANNEQKRNANVQFVKRNFTNTETSSRFSQTIKSPTQFLDQIRDIQINNDELMISFDVTALFTSIEPQLAKETISLLLNNDTNLTKYTTLFKFKVYWSSSIYA
uniref:Uncharacterized protein n=1 Tax=Schistosoma haematobium TaxID=6185 RepID=A0A095A8P9_SCHHA